MSILQIKQSQREARVPVTVFELIGEMDASTSEQFQQATQQAIETGTRYIVLDCSQLSYISSAGLRNFYALLKALSAQGGSPAGTHTNTGSFKSPYLKLFNPSAAVRQALEVMGFNMSMEIHSDLNQVLSSF